MKLEGFSEYVYFCVCLWLTRFEESPLEKRRKRECGYNLTKEKESRYGNFEKRRTRRKVQFKVCLASLSTIITAIITSWAGAESNNFSSFHPISYLLFISKIPEKIVVSQVLAHLFGNNLFEQFQSSFCPIDSQENSLCKIHQWPPDSSWL